MPNDSTAHVKKIAFVAMPFGTKPTGASSGLPSRVDFDALWSRAIKPALEKLEYRPIRADEQSGTVIIKDMLAQLVHADLVLADISIPNGNVYYEAGIRHAAKSAGCVLINASWSRPLFDLQQITQLRYPFDAESPSVNDYQQVIDCLVQGLPALVDSAGPVYELVHAGEQAKESDSRRLREQADAVFDFDVALGTAIVSAMDRDGSLLRELVTKNNLAALPNYALRDLVDAVRDNLNWGELLELLRALPDAVQDLSYFQEQKALALGMSGDIAQSIGLLEALIKRDGATPERLGFIGARYREQARAPENTSKSVLGKAIRAYKEGASLDLNDYYCAHKLLVTSVERGRKSDLDVAERAAIQAELACERAGNRQSQDEWLAPTRLILSFFRKDCDNAEELVDLVLESGWANWKLVGLLIDLKTLLGLPIGQPIKVESVGDAPGETNSEQLTVIAKRIEDALPVPQSTLVFEWLPRIHESGRLYRKVQQVRARSARDGEVVVSITSSGEESTNTAKAGDVVVMNLTEAQEEYIVKGDTFGKRYKVNPPLTHEYQTYSPSGEVRAIEITHEITTALGVGNSFFIESPWDEPQFAKEGDYLVSPSPAFDEVYRIGKSEFEQTYGVHG